MLVAVVALILSLTGGALAASLITTGDIQNGAVTKKKLHKNAVNSKKVKNKTLKAKDFAEGQLEAGVQGIQGLKGEKGDKGEQGDTGPVGPSDAYSAGNASSGGSDPPITKDVPAGVYFVTAQVVLHSATASTDGRCDLTGGSGHAIVFGHISNTGGFDQDTLTATMVTTFDAPGTLTWACGAGSLDYSFANLNAVKVETSN